MEELQNGLGADASLNRQIADTVRKDLEQELTRIDPAAIKADCFWSDVLYDLDAEVRLDRFLPDPVALDPPSWEEWKRERDREFYESLGEERAEVGCRESGCDRGAIPLSVFCRAHHFENVMQEQCPFTE